MAALEQDRYIWRRDGQVLSVPVAEGVRIFKGSLVCTSLGLARPAADTNGFRFCGIAISSADNIAGTDGQVMVKVWQCGVFPVFKPGSALQDVGLEACAVDDQTVDLASVTTNDVRCGRIVRILSDSEVEIKIDGYAY